MSGSSGSGWTKTIYRVRGIFPGLNEEGLCRVIEALFDVQSADLKVHSLALGVVEGNNPREKVATVTFRSTPAKLCEPKCQSWSFEIPGSSEYYIYFDTLFKGLTPLTPEKNDSASDLDCVFIHGWGGSALGSLIADDPKYVWLRDDLPSRFPKLRVWTYGYGARLTDETYVSDPFEEAESLKHTLRSLRYDPKQRPIIFIVHSLGGLIFKQAIISISKSRNLEDKQNLELISGALFFGVPGNGMDVQSMVSMVQGIPSQYTLNLLDEDVGFRQRFDQDNDFNRVWTDHRGRLICYFLEQRKTSTVVKTTNGWSRNGPLSLLVKPGSATFGRYNQSSDSIITLDKDHNSMIKFSRGDREEYCKVWRALQSLVDTAAVSPQERLERQGVSEERKRELELEQQFVDDLYSQVLQSRTRQIAEAATGTYEWIFDDEDSSELGDTEDMDRERAMAEDDDLGDEDFMEVEETLDTTAYASTASQSRQDTTASSNESAESREKKRPYDTIVPKDSTSLPQTQPKRRRTMARGGSTAFSEWLRSGRGIYWITGKPGSGKSTMMKFIAKHSTTKKALQAWASPMEVTLVSFYFWVSGSPLQRSLLGLLQSIFHQIVDDDHSLIQLLFPREWRKLKNSKDLEWTENSFMDAVERLQDVQNHHRRKFCFLVDGLDEYKGEEDHEWLCCFLLKLSNLENIKMCVSSRYWLAFQSAFSKCPTLRLHEWTRSDIDEFIHQQLKVHHLWIELQETNPNQAEELVRSVAAGAEGVFLWVLFVTRSLIKGLEKGDSFSQLQAHLSTMPRSLDGLFRRVLQDIPEKDRDFVMKSLLVVKTHSTWYAPPLIVFGFLLDETTSLNRQERIIPYLQDICTRTRRRLIAVCSDLLTVDDHNLGEFERIGFAFSGVRFAHRTIGDYISIHADSELTLLQDGSKFDETAYFGNIVLVIIKALPADVPKTDVIEAIICIHSIWFLYSSYIQHPSKVNLRFEGMEEISKTILEVLKAMAIDTQAPWRLRLEVFLPMAERPTYIIDPTQAMFNYLSKQRAVLYDLQTDLAEGVRMAYHSPERQKRDHFGDSTMSEDSSSVRSAKISIEKES